MTSHERGPRAWNQWPEISWRDPTSPGHIGDVPHAWIGAEYMLAFRTMLVFEREADRSLVIGAGVPAEWLDGEGVAVANLPTYYGSLSFRLWRRPDGVVSCTVAGDLTGPRGAASVTIILQPPLPGPLTRVEVNGSPLTTFAADSVTLAQCPAEVLMWC